MKKIFNILIAMLLAFTSCVITSEKTNANELNTYGVIRNYSVNKISDNTYNYTHNDNSTITYKIQVTGTYTKNGEQIISASLEAETYNVNSGSSLLTIEVVSCNPVIGYSTLKANVKVRYLYGGSSMGTVTHSIAIV